MSTAVSYPVQLDLRGRRVLVVGAGRVAAGKIERLVPTGAQVTVVAPDAVEAIAVRTDIRWHRRVYQRGEVASYQLAISATGRPEVDGQVYADGDATGIFVNAADDREHCSFTLPAVARSGPVSVSVATEGRSPALASWLRDRYQLDLDDGVEPLAQLLTDARAELRAHHGTSEHSGWHDALDDGLLELVRRGELETARTQLRSSLGLTPDPRRLSAPETAPSPDHTSQDLTPQRQGLVT